MIFLTSGTNASYFLLLLHNKIHPRIWLVVWLLVKQQQLEMIIYMSNNLNVWCNVMRVNSNRVADINEMKLYWITCMYYFLQTLIRAIMGRFMPFGCSMLRCLATGDVAASWLAVETSFAPNTLWPNPKPATVTTVADQVVWCVSGLLNPSIASLHWCRLTAVLAGSTTGKWRRKQHTKWQFCLLTLSSSLFYSHLLSRWQTKSP